MNFFTNAGPKLDESIPINKGHRNPKYYLKNPSSSLTLCYPLLIHRKFVILLILWMILNPLGHALSLLGSSKWLEHKSLYHLAKSVIHHFKKASSLRKTKIAKLIPIHKKGSIKDVNNYRPISFFLLLSKLWKSL